MEHSTAEGAAECSVLLQDLTVMKSLQQGEYISIQQGCQQLRLNIGGGPEIKAEKDEFYRQVSAQLEEIF